MSCDEFLHNFTTLVEASKINMTTELTPSQTAYKYIHYYIHGIALPMVCAFGVLGNILNLIVLTRKQLQKSMDRMEKSAHLGLVALAVVDMLFCLVCLPVPFIHNSYHYTSQDSMALIYFDIYHQSFLNIFLFCSNWLTVVMTSARYLAICHPLHARGFINIRGTRIGITLVFIISILLNLPQFWQLTLVPFPCAAQCICYNKAPGNLFKNKQFFYSYKITWAVLGTFIPVAILGFCNCCLIRALRQSFRMQRMYRANAPKDSGHRITPTLITIVILFIILVCPSEFLQFLKDVMLLPRDPKSYDIYHSANDIMNFLQACNFAINFVLYCVINVHFRETIQYVFCCKWAVKRKNYVKANQSTTNQTYITDMETEM